MQGVPQCLNRWGDQRVILLCGNQASIVVVARSVKPLCAQPTVLENMPKFNIQSNAHGQNTVGCLEGLLHNLRAQPESHLGIVMSMKARHLFPCLFRHSRS